MLSSSSMRFAAAYAITLCTQAAVVFAFSSSSSLYTRSSVTDVTDKKFLAAASVPSERIAQEVEDSISLPTALAESGILQLDEVDNLIPSCSDQSINQNILAKINLDIENDVRWAKETPLPFESDHNNQAIENVQSETERIRTTIEYEPISVTASTTEESSATTTIAVRTKPSTPLLSQNDISLLREAVEIYWKHLTSSETNDASTKSRFTYQRKGNSEAHLSDVVRYYEHNHYGEKRQQQVSALVNKLLLDRVYPLVRDAFLSKENESNNGDLYVYDAIFIRYNATEADNIGAGQPLHRDLGYVSVNIMLNSQDEFQGGGTFFENQILPVVLNEGGCTSNDIHALKPLGPGHAIAHYSSDRHAGAATFGGVRDILVLFVAVAADVTERAPKWEVAARLKSTARTYCSDAHDGSSISSSIDEQLLCRVRHHRLAIEEVPSDGEAWHYLGMALLDYHSYDVALKQQQQQDCTNNDCSILRLAISCLEEATTYTPCDGRLLNNLGIARERLYEIHLSQREEEEEDEMSAVDLSRCLESLRGQVAEAFSRSIQIHTLSKQAGCDVNADYESACLNYGLFLSKLDDFEVAIDILSLVVDNYEAEDTDAANSSRVLRDASSLLDFCRRQI